MSNFKVIAISANWHGAGKSTVAKTLQQNIPNSEIISLATPIKELACSMGWDGTKDAKGRKLLQLLGTDCGRNCINQDIWVNKWLETALASGADTVICDDIRFQSEYEFLKHYTDCTFIHVERSESLLTKAWRRLTAHESEKGIRYDDALHHPHVEVINDYTSVQGLQDCVKQIARGL